MVYLSSSQQWCFQVTITISISDTAPQPALVYAGSSSSFSPSLCHTTLHSYESSIGQQTQGAMWCYSSFFQTSPYARANVCITKKKTKEKLHHMVWKGKTKCTRQNGPFTLTLHISLRTSTSWYPSLSVESSESEAWPGCSSLSWISNTFIACSTVSGVMFFGEGKGKSP